MIFLCSVSCFYTYSLQCMHLECNCSSLLFCSTTYFSLVCLYQFRCSIPTGKEPDFLHDYNMVLYRSVLSQVLCVFYVCYWKGFQMLKNCSESQLEEGYSFSKVIKSTEYYRNKFIRVGVEYSWQQDFANIYQSTLSLHVILKMCSKFLQQLVI